MAPTLDLITLQFFEVLITRCFGCNVCANVKVEGEKSEQVRHIEMCVCVGGNPGMS